MKIAVLGAGAMGSWFGGRLAQQGEDVVLITRNRAHRDAVNAKGLQMQAPYLSPPDNTSSVKLSATSPADHSGDADLIILLTKSFQGREALLGIKDVLNENTQILSLQNGLGNAEIINEFLPRDNIWVGVSMMPVDRIAPGIVECKGSGFTCYGPATSNPEGHSGHMGERIDNLFAKTDLSIERVNNIQQRIWEKAAFNTGMNALSALSRGTPGDIGNQVSAKRLAQTVAEEVAAVADALGITVAVDQVCQMIDLSCEKHGKHIPSMLQDVLDGRQTEVDALHGYIKRKAEEMGVHVPATAVLDTLLRLTEQVAIATGRD